MPDLLIRLKAISKNSAHTQKTSSVKALNKYAKYLTWENLPVNPNLSNSAKLASFIDILSKFDM